MASGDPRKPRDERAHAVCMPADRRYWRWRYSALDMVSPIRV